MDQSVERLRKLIANGDIENALDELLQSLGQNAAKSTFINDTITIKSRLNQHNRSVIRGTMGFGEQSLEKNQIVFALLDLIDKIYTQEILNDPIPPTPKPESEPESGNSITILFVTANADPDALLRLDVEMREIEDELTKAKFRDKFTLIRKAAARISDLQDGLLNHNPDFVHFSGHGNRQGILLHGSSGGKMTVNNESLAQLFALFKNKLACVFLSSCYSEIQGQIINEHIPNVIGMRDKVPQETAIAFAKAFYKSLGAGRKIDFSFEFAKISVGMNNLSGEEIPVFHQR